MTRLILALAAWVIITAALAAAAGWLTWRAIRRWREP